VPGAREFLKAPCPTSPCLEGHTFAAAHTFRTSFVSLNALAKTMSQQSAWPKSLFNSAIACFSIRPLRMSARESPSRLSLDPKSHRQGHLAVAAVRNCICFHSSANGEIVQAVAQLDFTENRA
jgi:hypothetical protein